MVVVYSIITTCLSNQHFWIKQYNIVIKEDLVAPY